MKFSVLSTAFIKDLQNSYKWHFSYILRIWLWLPCLPHLSFSLPMQHIFYDLKKWCGQKLQGHIQHIYYIKPTSQELDPEQVILHVGTNNLNSPLPPKEIADGIIDLTKSLKTDNRNITISTIIPRGDKLKAHSQVWHNFWQLKAF